MVTKGEQTRSAILERAAALATRVGLEGVTIGHLADELQMSKSGLFAHFRSKDGLTVAILEFAAQLYTDRVIRPALAARRGEPRLRELFERWLQWEKPATDWSGCPFVAAAAELDNQPGPARDTLVRAQQDLFDFLAGAVRIGVAEGHFAADTDGEQVAQEMYRLMLGYHHVARLLRDPAAEARVGRSFDALLTRLRPAHS